MGATRALNKLDSHHPFVDLSQPEYAYLFGLLQADGHLHETTRNRGKLTLELAERDAGILPALQRLFPCRATIRTRGRTTNFSGHFTCSSLTVWDLGTREEFKRLGLPPGSKSGKIAPPLVPYSAPDYFRGLIDGDGSLGVTSKGYPFVSLVTDSEALAVAFVDFIKITTGLRKSMNRNRRDGVFNITVFLERAQHLMRVMYYPGCLALPRKLEAADKASAWERPAGMRKVTNSRSWSAAEDEYVLVHSIQESVAQLGRSRSSVVTRRWRLKKMSG